MKRGEFITLIGGRVEAKHLEGRTL